MKLAVVVQRYGAEINGGAELHARYVAERLARHAEVEVLTTCAQDYVTWRNAYPAGSETLGGILVRRFPVARERKVEEFGQRSEHVFNHPHSLADELAWLDSEGPTSPKLIRHITAHQREFDFFIFFSYRYYHAYHGVHAVPSRAVLVPTAERDPVVGLRISRSTFRTARALMFNSPEEQAMIRAVAGTRDTPGVVVGVGSEIPESPEPERFRSRFGIHGPFALYLGRIDENKGCKELFEYFLRFAAATPTRLSLVLVGQALLPIPDHPRIRHLGFLPDADKFDALAASELLIMPSYYESLSMVALEAWALGKPVLANGRCDVLRGQAVRSNAGLYYETYAEFAETLYTLETNKALRLALGRNGAEFFRLNYSWDVIEGRYLDMLRGLQRLPAPAVDAEDAGEAAQPGVFARRRRDLPPANDVLASLPRGPVLTPTDRRSLGIP